MPDPTTAMIFDWDGTYNHPNAPTATLDSVNAYVSTHESTQEYHEENILNPFRDAYVPAKAERDFFFRYNQENGVRIFYGSQRLMWLLARPDDPIALENMEAFKKLFPNVQQKILEDTEKLKAAIMRPAPDGKVAALLRNVYGVDPLKPKEWLDKIETWTGSDKSIYIAAVCDTVNCQPSQVTLYDDTEIYQTPLTENCPGAKFIHAKPLGDTMEADLAEILRVEFLNGNTASDLIPAIQKDDKLTDVQKARLSTHPVMLLAKQVEETIANCDKYLRSQGIHPNALMQPIAAKLKELLITNNHQELGAILDTLAPIAQAASRGEALNLTVVLTSLISVMDDQKKALAAKLLDPASGFLDKLDMNSLLTLVRWAPQAIGQVFANQHCQELFKEDPRQLTKLLEYFKLQDMGHLFTAAAQPHPDLQDILARYERSQHRHARVERGFNFSAFAAAQSTPAPVAPLATRGDAATPAPADDKAAAAPTPLRTSLTHS